MKKVKLGLKKALDMDHTHCFTWLRCN
jgi:hypothetical protein